MAYENTQIGPDGIRRPIKNDSVSTFVQELKEKARDFGEEVAKADPNEEISDVADPVTSEKEPSEGASLLGVVEAPSDDDSPEVEVEVEPEKDDFPKHLGRGVYVLRSGKKVTGKVKARKAQDEEDE